MRPHRRFSFAGAAFLAVATLMLVHPAPARADGTDAGAPAVDGGVPPVDLPSLPASEDAGQPERAPALAPPAPTPPAPAPPAPAPPAAAPAPPAPAAPAPAPARTRKITPSGYIETYYAWNFNRPSNGITNWRAFDNRHNTFALSNAVFAVDGEADNLFGRIALQVGSTGETYYASEPFFEASDGAGSSGAEVWKHVQEAYGGFTLPFAPRVKVDAGLFLSPIGPESMAIKDTFLWSRSNLFFALPFYHTGARVAYALGPDTTLRAAVYNGWNTVVDNNDEKSLSLKLSSKLSKAVTFDAQYFSGVERPAGAPEGRAWRHLLDTYVILDPIERLTLIVNADVGIEPNRFGTSGWVSGALHARVKLASWMFVGARGDALYEDRAADATGRAAAIFFPAEWVTSGAFGLDVRPHPQASVRLEYRHDAAASDMFFRGSVPILNGAFVSNARSQDTLTLGLTAWF
jgi:hypothetical protein